MCPSKFVPTRTVTWTTVFKRRPGEHEGQQRPIKSNSYMSQTNQSDNWVRFCWPPEKPRTKLSIYRGLLLNWSLTPSVTLSLAMTEGLKIRTFLTVVRSHNKHAKCLQEDSYWTFLPLCIKYCFLFFLRSKKWASPWSHMLLISISMFLRQRQLWPYQTGRRIKEKNETSADLVLTIS